MIEPFGDLRRALLEREERYLNRFRQYLQLLLGCRPVNIGRYQQGTVPLFAQRQSASLPARVVLPEP